MTSFKDDPGGRGPGGAGPAADVPAARPRRGPARKKAARPNKKKASSASGPGAIALTGAASFLGSNLLSYLRAEDSFERVVVLDVEKPALPIRKTRFYKTDLTEPNCDSRIAEIFEREDVRQVVHLAFFRSPQRNNTYVHELEVIGTLHLLHACAQCKVKKFATVTTTLAYGARPDNPNFLTEEMPLRADRDFAHIQNKVEAEQIIERFAQKNPRTQVTVLRPCLTLGPRMRTFVTRFFSRPAVPTVMGYDPLMQFVHEDDVVSALHQVVGGDYPGVYNIVGEGVLPLSTILRVGGKWALPSPSFVLSSTLGALWLAGGSDIPSQFIDYLRYLCIADGEQARQKLDFRPRYSTKDAWLAFTGEERLRRFRPE